MTIAPNILTQFTDWFEQAHKESGLKYSNAVHLSTGGVDNRVAGRIVLLKEYDERGFVFYTDYNGRKSMELMENPAAALTLYWETLSRQIRIEGVVEKVSDAESDAYFAGRPRESQVGAWASEQSEPLASRQVLIDKVKEYELKFLSKDVPRPPNWGGWRVVPDMIEFWQEGDHRLHVRDVYKRQGGQWEKLLLNPLKIRTRRAIWRFVNHHTSAGDVMLGK